MDLLCSADITSVAGRSPIGLAGLFLWLPRAEQAGKKLPDSRAAHRHAAPFGSFHHVVVHGLN